MKKLIVIGLVMIMGFGTTVYAGGRNGSVPIKIEYKSEYKDLLNEKTKYEGLYNNERTVNQRLQRIIDSILSGDDELSVDGVDMAFVPVTEVRTPYDSWPVIVFTGFMAFILGSMTN